MATGRQLNSADNHTNELELGPPPVKPEADGSTLLTLKCSPLGHLETLGPAMPYLHSRLIEA